MATGDVLQFVLYFGEHRTYIRNWKRNFPLFLEPKIPFCTRQHLMRMAECLNPCLTNRMPLSALISITLRSSTVFGCVKPAKRHRYKHNDMSERREFWRGILRHRIIVTDGVFSMDGTIAQLDKIIELAEKYKALMHDRWMSCFRIRWENRTWSAWTSQEWWTDWHHHRNFGKSIGRSNGRFIGWVNRRKRDNRIVTSAIGPFVFSNSICSKYRRCFQGWWICLVKLQRFVISCGKHRVFQENYSRFWYKTRRTSHRTDYVGEAKLAQEFANEIDGRRNLCDWFLLSCRRER